MRDDLKIILITLSHFFSLKLYVKCMFDNYQSKPFFILIRIMIKGGGWQKKCLRFSSRVNLYNRALSCELSFLQGKPLIIWVSWASNCILHSSYFTTSRFLNLHFAETFLNVAFCKKVESAIIIEFQLNSNWQFAIQTKGLPEHV